MLLWVCFFFLSIYIFFNIIPKRNPYKFPKIENIDKYNYIDENGACYKYVRKVAQTWLTKIYQHNK